MFAVGHFALGYLFGRLSAKIVNVSLSLPLVFFASVLPDTDILFPFIEHRGPLHSVFFNFLIFLPLFCIYQKQALPYFFAVLQHSLVGDFLTGGVQLFWPFSTTFYGLDIGIRGSYNMALEWVFFIASMMVMIKFNDLKPLLERESINLVLVFPLMTVLLPIIVNFPLYIPIVLVVPHVFFIGLFVVSLCITTKHFQN
jgi:membrane-bound metal-dependent hydrolase YbcI (DUF457 family)